MKRVIVDNLKILNSELVCKDISGRYKSVFKKQGSLDGACATYSVIMNLLILGVISEKDTWINASHKTKEAKKLFKVFCNDYGMHRNGQTYFKIKKMLIESVSSVVNVVHKLTTDKNSVAIIKETIDSRIPIIISIGKNKNDDFSIGDNNNDNWGHAMLAIGYEENDRGLVSKILCLDPSGDYIHGRKRWNSEIQITPRQYRLSTVWDGVKIRNKIVTLEDVLVITKNEDVK